MSEPTEAVYEAARAKYDAVVISHGAFGYRAGHYDAIRAAIDAVWPLAVAEGRRQAAADPCPCQTLRDQPHPSRDNGPDCSWCGRPAMAAVHDPRHGRVLGAQIKAEGVEDA